MRRSWSATTPRAERIDQVTFHPAYHALMRRSMLAGLHCSTFDRGEDEAGLRHRARAVRLYMTAQTECGHLCPMTMTNASLATPEERAGPLGAWAPRILSRTYDRNFRPAEEKRGVTIGMGMTEKQGGTDVRANTDARRARLPTGSTASPATNGSSRRRCRTPSWCWRRRQRGSPAS